MSSEQEKPVVAITMGDPAGVGPEIVVKTLQEEEIYNTCKPFVIGTVKIIEKIVSILGIKTKINKITSPKEALYELGTMDVLEPENCDCDSIELGKVQAKAGEMSYAYIKKSIELGLNKEIDAVSTAPINKEAIRIAGVKYIGQTEIYQGLTNSEYALTMFSVRNLRVFFVSRHIALRDACDYASKEKVLEFVVNIDKELKKLKLKNPKIAVAALNPHGSDNGLFGTEEGEQLIPAVEAAKEMGINAVGPVPADSVFHLGLLGRYDAILSLYHDQGHIACKTLDFEKSITLTLGLPFIRSSVDHGTAFDIAGKGIAGHVSMMESTRLAAEYSKMMKNA
ncbi:4-hydroxythreonine-4-phosphate dehydrogenase PdxA [Clostridium sp. AWRP]|uniref:4-hydroxythreonine-4-phosphate dehydrogenase PdxA n=1 Tax=Clostridium sp. AWRP TaxID=2212991 RepID=UPI000FDC9276|nr:4-hydroxythreonine-4-phosphate dehydrogenase PdxA [Clostridium sp. AWRP]AZV58641.1 4-hydroxythreonine-4-phosphate dehydrogenase PdxA [Clostridium sp. AWRP]